MTVAAIIWLSIVVVDLATGEFQRLPAWRAALKVLLVPFALAFLWESWKPGGLWREGRS